MFPPPFQCGCSAHICSNFLSFTNTAYQAFCGLVSFLNSCALRSPMRVATIACQPKRRTKEPRGGEWERQEESSQFFSSNFQIRIRMNALDGWRAWISSDNGSTDDGTRSCPEIGDEAGQWSRALYVLHTPDGLCLLQQGLARCAWLRAAASSPSLRLSAIRSFTCVRVRSGRDLSVDGRRGA